ncbi:hypothetical protein [Roseivirga sp.]|uniref:hypothetical protein n=1 Tax=Roseivirga sp. TaxID=1964215 RepID=UPI002B26704A|nr:hypothetical protein [Roseivirga sp.]
MKQIYIIILSLIFSSGALGQHKSDLYHRIDSLIIHEIKYNYDSTTDVINMTSNSKLVIRSVSQFPSNPSPMIILDGEIVKKEELNNYKLRQVGSIEVFQKGDSSLMALYSTLATNGAIIIRSKKFIRKNKQEN